MATTESRSSSDRQRILVKHDYRCAGCKKQFHKHPDQLVLDHVQERWDNGPNHDGNYQLLCKAKCNKAKTKAEQVRRQTGRPRERDGLVGRYVSAVVGVGFLIGAAEHYRQWHLQQVLEGYAAAVVLSLIVFDLWYHHHLRRRMRERITAALAPLNHLPQGKRAVKVHRWAGWWYPRPVAVTLYYRAQYVDTDSSLVRAKFLGEASRIAGVPLFDAEWQPDKGDGRVRAWEGDPEPVEEAPAEQPPQLELDPSDVEDLDVDQLQRVVRAARQVVGEVRASRVVRDPGTGRLVSARLHYPAEFEDSSDDKRVELLDRLNAKLHPDRYRAEWHTGADAVDLELRPAMPARAPNPATHRTGPAHQLAVAVDEDGRPVTWDMLLAAHSLIAGATRSGKTVCLRTIITAAAAAGVEVRICDPKQVELVGFEGWPGVLEVATTLEDMQALITRTFNDMQARYAAVKANPELEDTLRPILLVVDEFAVLNLQARQAHGKASTPPVIELWQQLGMLGGRGRVHMGTGVQYASAKLLGGDASAREQFKFRLGTGPLDPQSSAFLFKTAAAGRWLPLEARGRATVDADQGRLAEVQVYWTPDPARPATLSVEDRQLLTELREAARLAQPPAEQSTGRSA